MLLPERSLNSRSCRVSTVAPVTEPR
jgi:hypothetical protein